MYITVDELKQKTNLQEIKDYQNTDFLEILIRLCSHLIDSYVGYSFTKEEGVSILVDGEGTSKLFLPKRIINVTLVKDIEIDYVYNINDIKIVNDRTALYVKNDVFASGIDNIKVVGDFGWEKVPKDVIDAMVILCGSYFYVLQDVDILRIQAGPFKSETIGDYSYQLKDKINSLKGEDEIGTGNQLVDQILQKYVKDFDVWVI